MRFVIADDHPLYLDAIRGQIARAFDGAEIHAFLKFDDALSTLIGAQEQPIDLVLLDFSMPGMNGVSGVTKAVAAAGAAPVAILSGVAEGRDVAACISAGARGFFTKTMESRVLTNAISVVLFGGTYVPTEFVGAAPHAQRLDEAKSTPDLGSGDFSDRDITLLRMVAAGASNKEIARHLELQEVTVKFYLGRLFRRLGVKNRAQAAVEAMRLNLMEKSE